MFRLSTSDILLIIFGLITIIPFIIIVYHLFTAYKERRKTSNYKLPVLKKKEAEKTKYNVVFTEDDLEFVEESIIEKDLKNIFSEEEKGESIEDLFNPVQKSYSTKREVNLPSLDFVPLSESGEDIRESNIEEATEQTASHSSIEHLLETDDNFSEMMRSLEEGEN